jgi:hypothetical protein
MPVSNPQSFRLEAQWQRVCAVCGLARPFQAHHVVDQAELRNLGIPKVDQYDTRNALRLCQVFGGFLMKDLVGGGVRSEPCRCHFQHENKVDGCVVKLQMLLDQNIEYAAEVMGAGRAYEYLHREYDDTEEDPRVEALLVTAELESAR